MKFGTKQEKPSHRLGDCWVYGVECSYTQYRYTGIAAITFLREVPLSDRRLFAADKLSTLIYL